MELTVNILKVGHGVIDSDDSTASPTVWAKLYCVSDEFSSNDMFTGFTESEMSIIDPETKLPSAEIATQISALMQKNAKQFPFSLKVKLSFSIQKKRQVLSVCGIAA